MTKVLLHMEDKFSVSGFLVLRQAAMVALTAVDSVPVRLWLVLFVQPDRVTHRKSIRLCLSQVTQFLTAEFYSLNYSLRQRLDILEVKPAALATFESFKSCKSDHVWVLQVLALAAQELSKPAANKITATASELTPYQSSSATSWRQEVEKRIQNKTKRISKVAARLSASRKVLNSHFTRNTARNITARSSEAQVQTHMGC